MPPSVIASWLTALVLGAAFTPAAADAKGVDWESCPDPAQAGFQCATVRVPLNYRQLADTTIRLSLIRHRATKPAHRIGTLFWNPGGPGAGGVRFLPLAYERLFPRDVRARFDIVSWDPRGVGSSTHVQCFASFQDEMQFFAGAPMRTAQGFPIGPEQMSTWIAHYREFGRRCKRRNGDLMRHVSTSNTAHDLDTLRRLVGDRTLNYLGGSYGTILGATYANLFPSRVRAMILDGNFDPERWFHPPPPGEPSVTTGMRADSDVSTAATLSAFLDSCGRVDTAHCAFSAGSPEATRAKFADLLGRLPVEITPDRVNYAQAVTDTIMALYHPDQWGKRASELQDLWSNGDASVSSDGSDFPTGYVGEEFELAVACSESPNPPPSAYPGVDALAQSRAGPVGPYWAWDFEPCSTWPARAANRYAGPWNRRTARPILVLGTTFDPATPYEDSVAMSQRLARARLLTMDGYGHTALGNDSVCVSKYAARYLIRGTLPPVGARCAQDHEPFAAGASATGLRPTTRGGGQ